MSNGLTLPFAGTFDSDKQVFAITQPAQGGVAIWAFSGGLKQDGSPGIGVAGTSYNGGTGVSGVSDAGPGVVGQSDNGTGVYGTSTNGMAVVGVSQTQDAINGTSSAPQHAGVSANNKGGGYGQWANSQDGTAVYGISVNGMAVVGVSQTQDAINGTSSAPQHAGVSANNNGGGYGLWANSPDGTAIYGQGNPAGYFKGDVHVTGTHIVDGDIVLTKGADCAEQFDVSPQVIAEPGTVMVITGSGELEPSQLPYDKRVAGVISGAGALRPAIILDRQQSDRGRATVALVGKVYCKVNADAGSIEVGDLLTTSAISGHAMKADDPCKAFGAVIGKALQAMKSGKGLIPVLIALQ